MSQARLKNVTAADAVKDAQARYRAATPKSAAAYDKACAVMPGGNTRTVLFYTPYPLTFTKGEGAHLWDADGHEYVDFVCEQSAGLYGHSHPRIVEAIEDALAGGFVLGAPNKYEETLARLVCERFDNIDLVRFCNSGTEANLLAITAARAVSGREKILFFEGAYHGGVLHFPKGPGKINTPLPAVMAPYNDIERTVALIDEHAADLAAVVLEPMMGGAGCIPATREFLQALRDACDRHGILLVFDEVMTSRLSAQGVQGLTGIRPDLTTLGKYVGGGMSFGAFGGRRDIMERFDPRRPDAFNHAGTFNNNVFTMAAGAVGLSEIYTPEAATELNRRGDRLRENINALFERRGVRARATGIGSLLHIHYTDAPIRNAADTAQSDTGLRDLMHLELLLRGFYSARRGYFALSLPLTDAELEQLVDAIGEIVDHWPGLYRH